jgi:hypothetical protein
MVSLASHETCSLHMLQAKGASVVFHVSLFVKSYVSMRVTKMSVSGEVRTASVVRARSDRRMKPTKVASRVLLHW